MFYIKSKLEENIYIYRTNALKITLTDEQNTNACEARFWNFSGCSTTFVV